MKIKIKLRRLWNFIERENLHRLLLIIVLLIIFSATSIVYFEKLTFLEAVWWSIVTLTTVGYGDISPSTLGGQMVAIVIMFFGIGVLGMFSAIVASVLVEQKIREDRGMKAYKFEEHLILCGWNERAKAILNELRADAESSAAPIILIANIDLKPIDDGDLHFIQGNITDETLHRANLAQAKTVIILGDQALASDDRDAKVVLNTLTVESLNPQVYTIVELANEANVRHCERAKANEIIVDSELSSNLISRAALNHGLSKVVSELLSSHFGNELYKLPVPAPMIGHQFLAMFTEMKQAHDSIVLAIQQGTEGQVVSNPAPDYQLKADDYVIVIAQERPTWA